MLGTSMSEYEGRSSLEVSGLLAPVLVLFLLDCFLVLGGK